MRGHAGRRTGALVGFAWLPCYPIWGLVIIAVAFFVVWAHLGRGRDVTEYN
jgi:hypothetical protein